MAHNGTTVENNEGMPHGRERGQKGLCILGSTGSIGTQTLQIVDALPGRFDVQYLVGNRNAALLIEQARRYQPDAVACVDTEAYELVKQGLADTTIEVLGGEDAAVELAARPDAEIVVAAVVGFAGLRPVIAALSRGATVALANKETLVSAGSVVMPLATRGAGTLLPVDSEHSAIFQCLQGERDTDVERIILTASGGPFRERPLETFELIDVSEALAHPNWEMGAKITIDSATMMNKGLEVIEARWLFNCDVEQIDVLIHPQSIVHSLVEFVDGSTKAQLGEPDMRVPIQYALTYPERAAAPNPRIDWRKRGQLDFHPPDLQRYPCLALAYAALRRGGTAPATLNAANEVAVAHFLSGRIRFVDIAPAIERAMVRADFDADPGLDVLVAVDAEARRLVEEQKPKRSH